MPAHDRPVGRIATGTAPGSAVMLEANARLLRDAFGRCQSAAFAARENAYATNLAKRVGAGRVEIAQADRLQAVGAVVVGQGLFDHQLAAAIGVDRFLAVVFANQGALRLAKDRRGRRKNHVSDAR